MDELRTCLGSRPAEMQVEVERGIPVTAEAVADRRLNFSWARHAERPRRSSALCCSLSQAISFPLSSIVA